MRSLYTELQFALEQIYRVQSPARVEDFRIDERQLTLLLGRSPISREMLLVHADGDETLIALYVAADLEARAETFLRERDAHGEHIDGFCALLEGVSHFVYLTYCGAGQERPVSEIELEVQAEVDKYLLLRLLCPDPALIGRLFDRFRLRDGLTPEQTERYRVANTVGRRYARWFHRQFIAGNGHRALDDARSLYRKPLTDKLAHVDRAA